MDAISLVWLCVSMPCDIDVQLPKFSMLKMLNIFTLLLMEFYPYFFVPDIYFSKPGIQT